MEAVWFPAGGRTEGGDSLRALVPTDTHRSCVDHEPQPVVKLRPDAKSVSISPLWPTALHFFFALHFLDVVQCLTQSVVFSTLSVGFWNYYYYYYIIIIIHLNSVLTLSGLCMFIHAVSFLILHLRLKF